jgi:hypothetical protein
MSSEQPEKPKIIVDDDWKEKVRAEKEALQKHQEPQSAQPQQKIPPASFALLLTSMATQALAEMGQFPDESGKATVRLDHAKHVIDTLGILETKTKGNLTADESVILTQLLHELRMTYVAVQQQAASGPKT